MLPSLSFVSQVLSQRNKLSLIWEQIIFSVHLCFRVVFSYFLLTSCCAFQGNPYRMVVPCAAHFASCRQVSQDALDGWISTKPL